MQLKRDARGLAEDMTFPDDNSPQPLKFVLTPTDPLLFYPVGMSRPDFEFPPDEVCFFPYGWVRPATLVEPVVRKAKAPVLAGREQIYLYICTN